MISLAIDTSAHLCAAALHDSSGDAILSQASEDIGRGHAERLMDVIAGVLAQARVEYSGIGRVIVTTGPGSFTGIRVGLATARGIALGLGIDARGVSVLEAAALAAREGSGECAASPLLAVMDARRGEAYCQVFDGGDPAPEPFVAAYHQLLPLLASRGDWLLCGSGAQHLNDAAGAGFRMLHELAAVPIATIARLGASSQSPAARPEPLYLRAPDAKPQEGFALKRA
jgi:tRNA threonylcarbamoyladenosine biosynthesis protein TsaB